MKRLALIAAAIAIATPAMADIVTPYGNGSLLVTPYNGTQGYTTSPPPQQSFIIPNTNSMPLQQQRPRCGHFPDAGLPYC